MSERLPKFDRIKYERILEDIVTLATATTDQSPQSADSLVQADFFKIVDREPPAPVLEQQMTFEGNFALKKIKA